MIVPNSDFYRKLLSFYVSFSLKINKINTDKTLNLYQKTFETKLLLYNLQEEIEKSFLKYTSVILFSEKGCCQNDAIIVKTQASGIEVNFILN